MARHQTPRRLAQYERELISQRTKEALAQKQARGERLGRPPTLPGAVVASITAERTAGATWKAITDRLNSDGVPTAQGGLQWYPATVRYVHLAAERAFHNRTNEGE